MPVYFFHLTEADQELLDPEGIERASLAAAEKVATVAAGELIAEAVKNGNRDYQGRLDVVDEHGARVLVLTFAFEIRVETMPPPAGTAGPRARPPAREPGEDRPG